MRIDPEQDPVEVLREFFEEHADDYLETDQVTTPRRSQRADVELLLRLDEMFPGDDNAVDAAEHDGVSLSFSLEELAIRATEEQIVDLMRLGLTINEYDSLGMNV